MITRYSISLASNILLLVVLTSATLVSASPVQFKVEKVFSGLAIPWGMAFLSVDQLIVTERSGAVKLVDLKSRKSTTLENTPAVFAEGQAGMLDVALSPDYSKSGWIYFTYVTDVDDEGATTLSRAKLKKDRFIDWQVLLLTKSTTDTGQHFGSRIAFDEKGYLYFGVGDRGERSNAQDLTSHAGTIMRLKPDGSVPEDNPFVGDADKLDEIWSYGHRNPQGLVYDKENRRLWEIEHGPRGGDEINLVEKGKNYGWPIISYGKEYWGPIAVGEGTHKDGMEQPVKVYTPSIAPGSLLLYTGKQFPQWQGNLFSGALKLRHINRVVVNEKGEAIHEERLLEEMNERIRSLAQSPDGFIYFATDNGEIYRITK